MKLYWICALILGLGVGLANAQYRRIPREINVSSCRTPDKKFGRCLSIKDCEYLRTILGNQQFYSVSAMSLIRQYYCGVDNANSIKVCCPVTYANKLTTITTKKSSPSSTLKPTYPPVTQKVPATYPATNSPSVGSTGTKQTGKFAQCGKSDRAPSRIVAGKPARLGDWPWMVTLGYYNARKNETEYLCGASLISDQWVVTAAHCILTSGSRILKTARLGDLNIKDSVADGATPVDIEVDTPISHPGYTASPVTNDIALIRLKTPVTFTKLIRPICLLDGEKYRNNSFYERKHPYITGWGAVRFMGSTSDHLLEAQVEIKDHNQCAKNYSTVKGGAVIDHRVLCASANGKDSCQGDSGGPLILPEKSSYYLAGIVSFGYACADPKFPGIYTRISEFTTWINSTMALLS